MSESALSRPPRQVAVMIPLWVPLPGPYETLKEPPPPPAGRRRRFPGYSRFLAPMRPFIGTREVWHLMGPLPQGMAEAP